MQFCLLLLLFFALLWPLLRFYRVRFAPALAVILALGGVFLTQAWLQASRRSSREALAASIPKVTTEHGFVGSQSCRACHPQHYDSWHDSFHRTMTQPATPEAVAADFRDVALEDDRAHYRLQQRGDEYWAVVDFKQPAGGQPGPGQAAHFEGRIALLTGQHHMQEYWVKTGEENRLERIPWAWLIPEQKWVPLRAVFLLPPDKDVDTTFWQQSCMFCHAVAGRPNPGMQRGEFHTHVAEYGIACEACHGAAEQHVRRHQHPVAGIPPAKEEAGDPTIIHPARLTHERSAQVCGFCHSEALFRPERKIRGSWNPHQQRMYRAGDPLEEVQLALRGSWTAEERQEFASGLSQEFWDQRFWADGVIRTSGREYNGMIESGCFQRGKLSCLSCHSMHSSHPNDQLAAKMESNEACLSCHTEYRENLTAHTHHAADSVGSQCYNCHMPHTNYGLLKAIRSHQITSPTVQESLPPVGRPNACNLCHLDQTLDWTAAHLHDWYGTPRPEFPVDEGGEQPEVSIAAGPLWMLRGHAGQRALAAWSAGWRPAQETCGADWLPALLAELLDDPYDAVRCLAGRSLQTLPEYADFEYRFEVRPDPAVDRRRQALSRWPGAHPTTDERLQALLLGADRQRDEVRFERVLQNRDQQRIIYVE